MGQPNCDAKRTERRAIGVEGAFFNTLLPRPRMPVDNASSWAANSLLLGRRSLCYYLGPHSAVITIRTFVPLFGNGLLLKLVGFQFPPL